MSKILNGGLNRSSQVTVCCGLLAAVVAMLLTPRQGASGSTSKIFSVMAADFITPLVITPRGLQVINRDLDSQARFAGYDHICGVIRTDAAPQLVNATRYCGEMFAVLGVDFILRDHAIGPGARVYLNEAFWKRAYKSDPCVVGRSIHFCGQNYQIAGVVRMSSEWLKDTDLWLPISSRSAFGDMASMRLIGQLRPGAGWEKTERQLSSLAASDALKEEFVESGRARLVPVEHRILFYAASGPSSPVESNL